MNTPNTKAAPANANPAAAGIAAAKADDAERDALKAAGKPLPASLTGKGKAPRKGKAPAGKAKAPGKAQAARKGKAPADKAKAPGKAQAPAKGKRAEIIAQANAGKLPPAPDWSRKTHYRAQHAALIDLVKAGDVRGLIKLELPTTITQLSRYRDLAVIALKARAGKAA